MKQEKLKALKKENILKQIKEIDWDETEIFDELRPDIAESAMLILKFFEKNPDSKSFNDFVDLCKDGELKAEKRNWENIHWWINKKDEADWYEFIDDGWERLP